jgi:hypothetical protein
MKWEENQATGALATSEKRNDGKFTETHEKLEGEEKVNETKVHHRGKKN